VRWKTKWSFDGKLCQEYFCKNYQNLIIGFQVTVKNVGDVFLGHSVDNGYAAALCIEAAGRVKARYYGKDQVLLL